MADKIVDVVVIGAGPVGLVLANELARFGLDIRIVEKNSTRSTWSKALMITSRTMTILENTGLNEEILSRGTVTEALDIHFNQRYLGAVSMSLAASNPTTRYPYPFILSQPDVEAALEHVLNKRGTKVEFEREAISVEELKDYVEITLISGQRLKARYVVGCDGAHSLVRHSRKEWKFEGRPVNVIWAQCDGIIADPQVQTARGAFFVGSKGFALRLPLVHQERRFRVIVNVKPQEANLEETTEFRYGRIDNRKPTIEQFNRIIRETVGTHSFEVTDPIWLTYFMVQERMVNNLRGGSKRLFLAGDAAHCHSPAGGQGMNMGIQDAHNIAWKLAVVIKGESPNPEKLLDSYTAERIPIIRETINLTANLVTAMTASGSWYAPIIECILSVAAKLKSFQKAVIPRMMQLTLCLTPTSDGILSTAPTSLIKPGTMLPDAAQAVFPVAASPNEGTTHLFHLLADSYKHVVLFFIAGHRLHEPHRLFEQFTALCEPYLSSLRPAILARTFCVGGFRKPDWAAEDKDILFLSTNSGTTDKQYGLDGKDQMGLLIIRPDGYIAYSTLVDESGKTFEKVDNYLTTILAKH